MNVVSKFTVYDLVLGDLEAPRPWTISCPFVPTSKKREQAGKSGDPRVTMAGEANSAQCHQQLPILGIKHTDAQELGYRP